MRFEIPQFIDIEDKIFGPFTWRQFVYLVGGAGAIFLLYTLTPFLVFLVLALPIGILSAALAFYQINNRPFIVIVESFFRYAVSARLYLWQKKPQKAQKKMSTETPTYLPPSQSKLASLSRSLELRSMRTNRPPES